MSVTPTGEVHSAAELFPLLSADELAALAEDIDWAILVELGCTLAEIERDDDPE